MAVWTRSRVVSPRAAERGSSGGFAVAGAWLPDERGCAVLLVGEERLLRVGWAEHLLQGGATDDLPDLLQVIG